MATWYCYYNEKGEKTIVTGEQLIELAENGQIAPETIIENMEGKKAPARKVKGLVFTEQVQSKPIAKERTDIHTLSLKELQMLSAGEWQKEQELERETLLMEQRVREEKVRQRREAEARQIEEETKQREEVARQQEAEAEQRKADANKQRRFCTNCGNPVSFGAGVCPSCGAAPNNHKKFCRRCGATLSPEQIACIKCKTVIAGEAEWAPFWCAIGILVGLVFIFSGVSIPGIMILIISVINFIVILVKMSKK